MTIRRGHRSRRFRLLLLLGLTVAVVAAVVSVRAFSSDPRLAVLDRMELTRSDVEDGGRAAPFGIGNGVVRSLFVDVPIGADGIVVPAGWKVVGSGDLSTTCSVTTPDATPECTDLTLLRLRLERPMGGVSVADEIDVVRTGPLRRPGHAENQWQVRFYMGL